MIPEAAASMYHELESMQGMIAIPRCYGWYELDLEDAWKIVGRDDDDTTETSSSSGTNVSPTAPGPRKVSLLLIERLGDSSWCRFDG